MTRSEIERKIKNAGGRLVKEGRSHNLWEMDGFRFTISKGTKQKPYTLKKIGMLLRRRLVHNDHRIY